MPASSDFERHWFDYPESRAAEKRASQPAPMCSFAAEYKATVEHLLAPLRQHPGLVAINQAKLRITDLRFAWEAVIPRNRRLHQGVRGKHLCIDAVWEAAYKELLFLQLSLEPVPLSLPPASKRSRKPKEVVPPPPDFYIPEDEDDT